MKKTLLFLALIITTFAFSQEINTVSGGVEFKLPSGATYSYSDNTQIYVTIDNTNKAKFYNKVGGQVFGSYYFYDISIDGDSLTSKSDFLNAINQISAFTQLSIDCGGGECCADSLTVIGNILYLFQNGDTLMAELPSGGGSSLWEIEDSILTLNPNTYKGINTNGLIINDSLDVGFAKVPIDAGYFSTHGAEMLKLNAFGNFQNFGQPNKDMYWVGFIAPGLNSYIKMDTNLTKISNDTIYLSGVVKTNLFQNLDNTLSNLETDVNNLEADVKQLKIYSLFTDSTYTFSNNDTISIGNSTLSYLQHSDGITDTLNVYVGLNPSYSSYTRGAKYINVGYAFGVSQPVYVHFLYDYGGPGTKTTGTVLLNSEEYAEYFMVNSGLFYPIK